MSNEVQRDQHSKRRFDTEVKSQRQARIAQSAGVKVKTPHLFAKKRAMDCGQPGCTMCSNRRRTHGERTIQEQRFMQNEQEVE